LFTLITYLVNDQGCEQRPGLTLSVPYLTAVFSSNAWATALLRIGGETSVACPFIVVSRKNETAAKCVFASHIHSGMIQLEALNGR